MKYRLVFDPNRATWTIQVVTRYRYGKFPVWGTIQKTVKQQLEEKKNWPRRLRGISSVDHEFDTPAHADEYLRKVGLLEPGVQLEGEISGSPESVSVPN